MSVPDARSTLGEGFISGATLEALLLELDDQRSCKRGPDGFERPLYVSPATWQQVRSMVAELIARRKHQVK